MYTYLFSGVGNPGEVLSLRPNQAYRQFLMPGLAVYANPDNLEKYKVDESQPKMEKQYSSPHVQRVCCISQHCAYKTLYYSVK